MAATDVSVCFVIEVYGLCVWFLEGVVCAYVHAFAHVYLLVCLCVCVCNYCMWVIDSISADVASQIPKCNKSCTVISSHKTC